MTRPPTGSQHELVVGDQVAVVTELGATLRSYDVAGQSVLDGFPSARRPDGGRGQILAPWPNRVRDGRYRFGGQDLQLALTEVANRNAIHGLVRWVGWQVESRADDSIALAATVWPQPGYPWLLRLRATYHLSAEGLSVSLTARNEGSDAAPYGVGHHPYLRAGDRVDDALLTLPAGRRLVVDDRGIPVGDEQVDGTAYDFRSPRAVGDLVLDDAYVDLQRAEDGAVPVRLDASSGDHGVELWADEATRCLQVFTGDTLEPARRRQGLAVEPMSCPPNALDTGDGLVVLDPDEEHTLRWGLRAW